MLRDATGGQAQLFSTGALQEATISSSGGSFCATPATSPDQIHTRTMETAEVQEEAT